MQELEDQVPLIFFKADASETVCGSPAIFCRISASLEADSIRLVISLTISSDYNINKTCGLNIPYHLIALNLSLSIDVATQTKYQSTI